MPIRKDYQVHALAAARRPKRSAQRAEVVQLIAPEKPVWTEALRRAQGDPKRLQTVAPNSVIVWNSEAQKRELRGKVEL
jgi:hypothetical protein